MSSERRDDLEVENLRDCPFCERKEALAVVASKGEAERDGEPLPAYVFRVLCRACHCEGPVAVWFIEADDEPWDDGPPDAVVDQGTAFALHYWNSRPATCHHPVCHSLEEVMRGASRN